MITTDFARLTAKRKHSQTTEIRALKNPRFLKAGFFGALAEKYDSSLGGLDRRNGGYCV